MKSLLAVIFLSLMLFTAGCSSNNVATNPASATDATNAPNTTNVPNDKLSLKVGVMPAVDSAPIFLADKKGYFTELGLDVDVQVYTNAMNRQSALQSGELDGAMTDVIALINNVENGFDIKVTTSTNGVFPVLFKGKSLDGKKDIKVAMMEVSVTNYLSDRFLGDEFNLEKVYINEIPARLEMINKGSVDAAVIPEPMASQGEKNGLTKQQLQNNDNFSPDVMVFTGKSIKNNEKAIKMFHQAYDKAVEEINKDDSEARDILIGNLKLSADIKENMMLPEYSKARVPSEEFLKGIMDWNEKVLKKKVNVKYENLVDSRFMSE